MFGGPKAEIGAKLLVTVLSVLLVLGSASMGCVGGKPLGGIVLALK